MMSLSDDTQAEVIGAFNSTSRYLEDLLNIDNPYFEGMVSQIYLVELQSNFRNQDMVVFCLPPALENTLVK